MKDWKFGDILERVGSWIGGSPPKAMMFIAQDTRSRDPFFFAIRVDELGDDWKLASAHPWPDPTQWRKIDDR